MEQGKRYTKGFILGKFMPPHLGHLHLIRAALEQTEELTVLVCTVKREPIPGLLRYQWMKALLPEAKVVHVTDEVPSYPHESDDFWPIWTGILQRENPGTKVFFSSEDYGEEVAERLGIKHVMIDKNRLHFPVSATAIRDFPFRNWHFIPDHVKPYFVQKIVLTGPESTGKTTMAQELAAFFNTVWVEEYGRDYFVERDGKLTAEDFLPIARGQVRLEEKAALKANKLLFCDTDVMVTQVWSEIYFGNCPQSVIEISHGQHYALHLLMDIDIPWENDGTREFPDLRAWHFSRLRQELDQRGLPYRIISGDFEARMRSAKQIISELLETPATQISLSRKS